MLSDYIKVTTETVKLEEDDIRITTKTNLFVMSCISQTRIPIDEYNINKPIIWYTKENKPIFWESSLSIIINNITYTDKEILSLFPEDFLINK